MLTGARESGLTAAALAGFSKSLKPFQSGTRQAPKHQSGTHSIRGYWMAVKVKCPVMRVDLSGKWNHSEMEVARHPGAITKVRGWPRLRKADFPAKSVSKGQTFLT